MIKIYKIKVLTYFFLNQKFNELNKFTKKIFHYIYFSFYNFYYKSFISYSIKEFLFNFQ